MCDRWRNSFHAFAQDIPQRALSPVRRRHLIFGLPHLLGNDRSHGAESHSADGDPFYWDVRGIDGKSADIKRP
jgi:hypothetical protein